MKALHLFVYLIFIPSLVFGFSESSKKDKKDSRGLRESKVKVTVSDADYRRLKKAIDSQNEVEVINAASIVLSKNQKDLKALNGLGFFYFSKGKLGLAKLIYQRALKDHGNEAGLYNNLGLIYLKEGELAKAKGVFKKAISLDSSYKVARDNLSFLFVTHKNYNAALESLESRYKSVRPKLRSKDDLAVEIANNYAVALMGVGQIKKAKAVLKEALKSNSFNASLLYNYAVLLVNNSKDKTEVHRIISKIKFNSNDPKLMSKTGKLEKRLDKQ